MRRIKTDRAGSSGGEPTRQRDSVRRCILGGNSGVRGPGALQSPGQLRHHTRGRACGAVQDTRIVGRRLLGGAGRALMSGEFLDTSALAKLYHVEAGSERMEALVAVPGIHLIISELTLIEIQSVFARKVQ